MSGEPDVQEPGGILIEPDVLVDIRAAAAAAYPNEGCGALLGRREAAPFVSATVPLSNSEKGTPRVRFSVSPRDYMSVEREADRRGLELLGFWHSHPDHPARPSATDRAFAWEGLLTLIVSVRQGEAGEVGAFQIAGPDAPFTEIEIFGKTGTVRPGDPAPTTDHGGT
ncbi:MAG: Mov34/MPN/PAD-1 family protein [Acidithiobacillales bacterium]